MYRARRAQGFPRFVHIEALLSNGLRQMSGADGYEAQLCTLFGLQVSNKLNLPLGALRRYGVTAVHSGKEYWLCADPVHMRPDRTHVVILDSPRLEIEEQESKEFVRVFNDHFHSQKLHLGADTAVQWHLCMEEPQPLTIESLRQMRGGELDTHLPSGEGAQFWRSLLNETQMLLHGAEPNRVREARGALPVNSLWFYGAGILPYVENRRWGRVWAQDALADGLALLGGVDVQSVPDKLVSFLAHDPQGAQLICLDSLAASSSYDELTAWQQELQRLEKDWFAPLTEALRQGTIAQCVLWDCCGQAFILRGSDRWKFWRKRLPLPCFGNPKRSDVYD